MLLLRLRKYCEAVSHLQAPSITRKVRRHSVQTAPVVHWVQFEGQRVQRVSVAKYVPTSQEVQVVEVEEVATQLVQLVIISAHFSQIVGPVV